MQNKYKEILKMKEELLKLSEIYNTFNFSTGNYFPRSDRGKCKFGNTITDNILDYDKIKHLNLEDSYGLLYWTSKLFTIDYKLKLNKFQEVILILTILVKVLEPENVITLLDNFNINYNVELNQAGDKLSINLYSIKCKYSEQNRYRDVYSENEYSYYDDILDINNNIKFSFTADISDIFEALKLQENSNKGFYSNILDDLNKVKF